MGKRKKGEMGGKGEDRVRGRESVNRKGERDRDTEAHKESVWLRLRKPLFGF